MSTSQNFKVAINLLVLMWIVQGINMVTQYWVSRWGIYPNSLEHLPGILIAPFTHGSLPHIISNSMPFFVLAILVGQLKHFWSVTLFVIIASGTLVWFFGRPATHVGASGLIMGYWGFLLIYGWLVKKWQPILYSLLVFLFYGGMVITVVDFRSHISYESHIFGLISGLVIAWILAAKK